MLIALSSSLPSPSEIFTTLFLVLLVGGALWMKGVPTKYMPWVMGGLTVLGGMFTFKNHREDAARADYTERFRTVIKQCTPAINFYAPEVPNPFRLDGKVVVSQRETSNTQKSFGGMHTSKQDLGLPIPIREFMKEPFTPRKAEVPVAVVFLKTDFVETGRYSGSSANVAFTATIRACLIQTSDQKVLGTMQFTGAPPESITLKKQRGSSSGFGIGTGESAALKDLAEWLTTVTSTAAR